AWIVERTLAGVETVQKHIRARFFGTRHYKPDSPIVKVTVREIRKRLRKYYDGPGKNDLVIISFPEPDPKIKPLAGESYRTLFAYNPNSEPERLCLLGHAALRLSYPRDFSVARQYFIAAKEYVPTYFPAYIGQAETLLQHAVFSCDRFTTPDQLLGEAEQQLKEVLRMDPRLARAHLLCGVVHSCRREWPKANDAFDEALAIDPSGTASDSWYAAFLMATRRRPDEAIRIAEYQARSRPDDPLSQILYGVFLYAARRFREAYAVVFQEFLYKNHWLANLMLCLLGLEAGDSSQAWGSITVCRKRLGGSYACSGLDVLCLMRQGRKEEAAQLLSRIEEQKDVNLLDKAVAYMATERWDLAIRAFAGAKEYHEPVMAWAHLWPVLDPLRRYIDEALKANPTPPAA
ncbi:MAG TPA: tetratricopeptide repeat protein, partial [Bryobacteraceae bacterium]|nr:tetratricopeptide repeat protein [Bryobacteraceae bacterium]